MSSNHVSLGAAANDRKARLAALKSLKRKAPSDEEQPPISNRGPSPPAPTDVVAIHLSGRNYDASTKGPKLGFEAPPTLLHKGPTLEQQAAEVEALLRAKALEEQNDDQGVDLFKLQPKKPNWDLKRDLDKKLEILNIRTDNSIAALVRERIENAQKVAKAKSTGRTSTTSANDGAEEVGMEGVALVEGLREREREDEAEKKREAEDEELV